MTADFRHTGDVTLRADGTRKRPTIARQVIEQHVAERIMHALTSGCTPRMAAQRLDLPQQLVDLVIEREQEAGRLQYQQAGDGRCFAGPCDPDPHSLVCAGCPIFPVALRRRQSLLGQVRRRLFRPHR